MLTEYNNQLEVNMMNKILVLNQNFWNSYFGHLFDWIYLLELPAQRYHSLNQVSTATNSYVIEYKTYIINVNRFGSSLYDGYQLFLILFYSFPAQLAFPMYKSSNLKSKN